MSYTTTDVIFKWSTQTLDNQWTISEYDLTNNIFTYFYNNIPILQISEPYTLNNQYVTRILLNKPGNTPNTYKSEQINISDILTLQEIREYKLNKILNENTI